MELFSRVQRLFETGGFAAQALQFLFDMAQTVLRRGVLLAIQRKAFYFKLRDAPLDVVDLDRHAADLNAQRCACFVDEVDRLVGQEAVGDIAMRKNRRGHDRGILDAHAVVDFELLLEPAQDGDGVVDRRLANHHGLEAARASAASFSTYLAVFGKRGGADAAQFAARESRLQHVGRIDRAFGAARTDERVQFVNEADDLAVGVGDLLENGLEAVFELAAELGARDFIWPRPIPTTFFFLSRVEDIAAQNALREAFDDVAVLPTPSSPMSTGLFPGAPAEHLHDAAGFHRRGR